MKRSLAIVLLLFAACVAQARNPCPADAPKLIVHHAGSLSAAFTQVEDLYTKQSGVCVEDHAGGSVSLARQVTGGGVASDIYAGADYQVIDQMMIPAGYADFSIRFADGAMVLAYTTSSRNSAAIAKAGSAFSPPGSIPDAAPDWTAQLMQPGVMISGSHPFLDPGAYRADMIFQLAQDYYGVPNLYSELLNHYVIAHAPGGLGKVFDYQFTYEHNARAAVRADTTGTYRFVRLPREINLGDPALESRYARRSVTMPDLQAGAGKTVTIPASRVTWGITLLKSAPNRENALAFLQLLLSKQGTAILEATGPTPVVPPVVGKQDFAHLPAVLKPLVQPQ